MSLDPRTIVLIAGLLSWLLAGVIEYHALKQPRKTRLPDFGTLALLAQGLGLGLFSQRGVIGGLWTVGVANVLLMGAVSLFYLGVEKIRGDSGSLLVAGLAPGMIALLFPIIGFSDTSLVERVAVFTIVSFVAYAILAVSALSSIEPWRRVGPLMIVSAVVIVIAMQIVRAVPMFRQGRGDLFASQAPQLLYHSSIVVAVLLATFGYVSMMRSAPPAMSGTTAEEGEPSRVS